MKTDLQSMPVWRNVFLVLTLATLMTGCGMLGSKPDSPVIERGENTPQKQPTQKAPATTSKGGGYYLDDGPGDNPPANIDAIPDAQPRVEPLLPRSNRPYVALGETYTPMTQYQPYKAQGVASWYGRRYHNQKTSSGEIYDMYGMTAAHPILPIPSYVRVTNPENGKAVIVRVNDRGPFKKDRLIDLSYAAAYKLGLVSKGSGKVEVEAIDARTFNASPAPSPTPAAPAAQPALTIEKSLETSPPAPTPATTGSFVQAGAFKRKENADQLRDKLRQQSLGDNAAENVTVENWYNDGVYRVRLGPYSSRDEAARAASQIKQTLGVSTLVITQ